MNTNEDIVYEIRDYSNQQICICDGYDRDQVIADAIKSVETDAMDRDEPGDYSDIYILYSYNNNTYEEKTEEVFLKITYEDDGYDGGRFDYLAAIGAV